MSYIIRSRYEKPLRPLWQPPRINNKEKEPSRDLLDASVQCNPSSDLPPINRSGRPISAQRESGPHPDTQHDQHVTEESWSTTSSTMVRRSTKRIIKGENTHPSDPIDAHHSMMGSYPVSPAMATLMNSIFDPDTQIDDSRESAMLDDSGLYRRPSSLKSTVAALLRDHPHSTDGLLRRPSLRSTSSTSTSSSSTSAPPSVISTTSHPTLGSSQYFPGGGAGWESGSSSLPRPISPNSSILLSSSSSSASSTPGLTNEHSKLADRLLLVHKNDRLPRRPTATASSSQGIATNIYSAQLSSFDNQTRSMSHPNNPDTLDNDVLGSMSRRLALVERLNTKQTQLLVEKEREIDRLREALDKAKHETEEERRKRKQCEGDVEKWRNRVNEMDAFLADYGLIWVGDIPTSSASSSSSTAALPSTVTPATSTSSSDIIPAASSSSSSSSLTPPSLSSNPSLSSLPSPPVDDIPVDPARLLRALRELNAIAGEGSLRLAKKNGAHQFVPPPSLSLTIFKNGLWLKDGPLRPYSLPECQAFLQDVLDGYFPAELRQEYPDGVVFSPLEDKSALRFVPSNGSGGSSSGSTNTNGTGSSDSTKFIPFRGTGNRLTDDTDTSSSSSSSSSSSPPLSLQHPILSKAHTNPTASTTSVRPGGPPLSIERFIQRLPKSIAADGVLVPVREGIHELLSRAKKTASTPGVGTPLEERLKGIETTGTSSLIINKPSTTTTPLTPILTSTETPAANIDSTSDRTSSPTLSSVHAPLASSTTPASTLPTRQPQAMVRVRLDGGKPFTLSLIATSTVGDLRTLILTECTRLGLSPPQPLELRTTFPIKILNDATTLTDARLVPSGTVVACLPSTSPLSE